MNDEVPLCPVCAAPMSAVEVGDNIYALPCFHWLYKGGADDATGQRAGGARIPLTLQPAERETLEGLMRSPRCPHGLHTRARAVLLVADGVQITEVARRVDLTRRHVYKWVARFQAEGMDGLKDKPRHGPGLGRWQARTHKEGKG